MRREKIWQHVHDQVFTLNSDFVIGLFTLNPSIYSYDSCRTP